MALIPIFLGRSDRLMSLAIYQFSFCSFRSVDSQKEQKDNHEKTGERPETMTQKDAMMFPLIASCALFGLYMIFNIFGKEYINMLLSFYFLVLGIFALSHMVSPVVLKLVPSAVPVIPFHLQFTQGEGEARESVVDYQFNTHDLVSYTFQLIRSTIIIFWFLKVTYWLLRNLTGVH